MNPALPTVITNPIPPEVLRNLREAFESKHGYFITINRVDEDGKVYQYRHKSHAFNGEHWRIAYNLLVSDFLKVDRPEELEAKE